MSEVVRLTPRASPPAPLSYTLQRHEIGLAMFVGMERRKSALLRGTRERFHSDKAWPIDGDVAGAAGELVVGKYLGIPWEAVFDSTEAGDVGPVEVRTRSKADADLGLRRRDLDGDPFVLVTCPAFPTVTVCGWIVARAGKLPQYAARDAKAAAWWVPQTALRPMGELLTRVVAVECAEHGRTWIFDET